MWIADHSKQCRLLAILEDLETHYIDTSLHDKELVNDDSLSHRLCEFLTQRLALSPEWSSESLKLYAKDLSFLVKWNFLPKIKEESQSIVALELKNHWKGLVESHSLTQDTRKSVQLPREAVRKIVRDSMKQPTAARDNFFYLLSCTAEVRPGYLLPTPTYEDCLTWQEVTLRHVIGTADDTKDKVVLGFAFDLKLTRWRGPNGYKDVEKGWSAGSVANSDEIYVDLPLYLVAIGFAQKVFIGIETMEDLWSYSISGLRIKSDARSWPVFQNAEGQAWRYYTAMRGYQTRAKQAGVIEEGQKAVFYGVTEAEAFREPWYQKQDRVFAEWSQADGWGEKYLDEADESIESGCGDEKGEEVTAVDQTTTTTDTAQTVTPAVGTSSALVEMKKAFLRRIIQQLVDRTS
ncbi:hypothetical protein FFLO_02216 [Filobasidium floriforme]|uniref:Uncharacterized protein n=1 Tax=Filobasidium floriforme TaxID=5210 RepID=A0A8K0NRY6_9TREE|nr:uncharacterized protein HD553DRAFT_320083 [Filobasidium floriforme]KAG7562324.1 hypothetical protein FFLO_02216 [Filobasidium floriforme]KAH8077922.1 hypothetical protein HD553DRAFT_320083 [Filobasidium floriforme]